LGASDLEWFGDAPVVVAEGGPVAARFRVTDRARRTNLLRPSNTAFVIINIIIVIVIVIIVVMHYFVMLRKAEKVILDPHRESDQHQNLITFI